jgi:CheY-like chemotaxis protein
MTRVLYIDDESALLTLTQIYLKEEAGLDIEIAQSAEEGLILLKKSPFDAIISDYDMPDIDGIEFLKQVREYDLSIPFIFFTGKGREEVAIEALNCGADFYIQKGGDPKTIFTELANAISHLVRRSRAEKNAIQNEQQLKIFLNSLPDLAFIKGPDLKYQFVNSAYLKFLSLSSDDSVQGKTDEEILPAHMMDFFRGFEVDVFRQKTTLSYEKQIKNKKYHILLFPLPFPIGTTGIGGVIREILSPIDI